MISRREFAGLVAATGAAAAMPAAVRAGEGAPRVAGEVVRPKHLSPGDTVGMVLPASAAFEESTVDLARQQIEAMGFEAKLGDNVRKRYGSLAGTDEERAHDVNAMFADPEVDGIFCYTGGWGTPRILPLVDYDAIRAHPKVFLGYSDITALHTAIHQETGLVTFHGPMAAWQIRPWSLEQLRRVIMSTEPVGVLENPPKGDDELVAREYRTLTIRGGRARGRLIGGNLTMLASIMGTPWEVETEGRILCLEDTHEAYYRIDRMLTQLALGGKLEGVAGIAFGYCTDCPTDAPSFSFEEILRMHFEPLGVPVLSGLAFGHIRKMLTLPIGMEATLDADAGTLTIDQSAVV